MNAWQYFRMALTWMFLGLAMRLAPGGHSDGAKIKERIALVADYGASIVLQREHLTMEEQRRISGARQNLRRTRSD